MPLGRQYDVVLYGATGFVGRQTVDYFATNAQVKASGLRWALAGRSQAKLSQVKQACAGATKANMNNGSYRCELIGKSANGDVLRGRVADKGDPGNRATTKMVCESALCLALDADKLPGGAGYGGVLTPAAGLGGALVNRLRHAGMTLVID